MPDGRIRSAYDLLVRVLRNLGLVATPRFRKVLLAVTVGFFVLLLGLLQFSTSPIFCRSCHIMKPYYDAWKASPHNHVACVACHYPPDLQGTLWLKFQASSQLVKYVTRTYGTRPYAEISDASCLRIGCHDTRLLRGKVTFKRGITFDHAPHLLEVRRGRQLRCVSCHSQVMLGKHMAVTEDTCFLCHFKGRKQGRILEPLGGCPSCHTPPAQDIDVQGITFNHKDFVGARSVQCQKCHLDVVQGTGDVDRDRCVTCHNEPDRLARFNDSAFLHENHVTRHNVACYHCHSPITHKVTTRVPALVMDCQTCHTGKHDLQARMYMGTGGGGVPTSPSVMFIAQVKCVACHVVPKNTPAEATLLGQTFEASEAGCVACHGLDFKGMLADWKHTLSKEVAEVEPRVHRVEGLLQRTPMSHPNYREAYNRVQEARHDVSFVELGRGVHNLNYAEALLSRAKEDAERAHELLTHRDGASPQGAP